MNKVYLGGGGIDGPPGVHMQEGNMEGMWLL